LILDEATSALDNESERIVQAALDNLPVKCTTIVIAHRLTTVRNADKIVVLGAGKGVLEQGTHEQLVAMRDGHYSALLAAASRAGDRGHARRSQRKLAGDAAKNNSGDSSSSSSEVDESEADEAPVAEEAELPVTDTAAGGVTVARRRSSSKGGAKVAVGGAAGAAAGGAAGAAAGAGKAQGKGKAKEKLYSVPMSRIFQFSRPERLLYVPFIFSAVVNGAQLPLFSILFAGISNVYFLPTDAQIQTEANKYSLYFIAFSVVGALSNLGAFSLGGVIGEKMTTRVRGTLFRSLLRQDMAFFDERANSIGALTSRLSTDAALIKASLADRMALGIMNVTTLTIGFVIAFIFGWQLTLVLLALLPLIVLSGAMQFFAMRGLANADEKLLENASQILSESISGIRTVTAFALRGRVVALYDGHLQPAMDNATKKGLVGGLGFGFSQGCMFVLYAIAFWYGSRLIVNDGYTFQDVINVFFAITMAGMGIGQTAAMAPDVAKSSVAVSNVYKILDRKTPIDSLSVQGARAEAQTNDDIVLDSVDFAYPSRPDAKVFDQFSLTIKAGTTVALVGMSGSGKSTAIKLLERFYDADKGAVFFHGIDTKTANVAWLRAQLGAVQQEPNLYEASIYDNIAAGVPGADDAPVPQEQVVAAAKAANVHDFIESLPDGYSTIVSDSTLSGGQKQRIAIARCLIREPRVLLLDEATSALDQTSERLVQEAIDKMTSGGSTTSIIVAHRLSSIQSADVICVVHQGKIVEAGTHDGLISRKGPYAKLYQSQQGRKH
jgi:ATP-binding cassette subfamily B (MDR/TAP) protein 1